MSATEPMSANAIRQLQSLIECARITSCSLQYISCIYGIMTCSKSIKPFPKAK